MGERGRDENDWSCLQGSNIASLSVFTFIYFYDKEKKRVLEKTVLKVVVVCAPCLVMISVAATASSSSLSESLKALRRI
jgi:hypothetical protein